VDLVLAGFLHFQEEVEYFGKRVLPLVRELEAKADVGVGLRVNNLNEKVGSLV